MVIVGAIKQFMAFIGIIAVSIAGSIPCQAAEKNLVVNFNYKGKPYSIHGRKVKMHTYLFNAGAHKTISITTLNWPPYIGENICKQGWVQQFTIALLASQGYEVLSTFYPWARTIGEAEHGKVDILYPEYYIESTAPSDVHKGTFRVEHLALSERFPGGTIAFMKRKGTKDSYKGDFYNLNDEKIGVVRGYQNTPEFDALMDKDFFSIDKAVDDMINARKLVAGRVNLIIGDPTVIRFSVMNSGLEPGLKQNIIDNLEIVTPYIQYNYLYYAVSKKRPGWKQTLEMLNRTIAEFEASGELFRIIRETNKSCAYEMDSLTPYKHAYGQ